MSDDDRFSDDWRKGAPRAHRYESAFCGDPLCGVHIIGFDINNRPMCEIVLSPSMTIAHIALCQAGLFKKAALSDE